MQTTVGRLAIEEILPKGFLDDYPKDKPFGHKDIEALLQRVAEERPDDYREVSSKLLRLGAKASVETGSSFSLSDLEWPVDKSAFMKKVDEEERKIFFDPKLSQQEKEKKLILLYANYSAKMPDISFDSGIKRKSNLAKMVASGARGNKSQLNSNVGADFLVVDQNKKPVPIGIKHSFAEGLSLPEYFAGGYGARAGTIDGKFAVRDAGFLCLGAGTLVLMSDFSVKKIEDVVVGDKVFGSDLMGNIREVTVTARFCNGRKKVYRFDFYVKDKIISLECTMDHKVLCEHGQLPIGVKNSSVQWIMKDTKSFETLSLNHLIQSWDVCTPLGMVDVYDIEVNHPDHLFVLANGLIVSNSKQLGAVSMDMIVTEDDCSTKNGIPVPVSDKDNIGAILARDAGGYKAGTIITPKIYRDLQSSKVDQVVLRSPITCEAGNGGICAHCAGIREKNKLPRIGENVGLSAASSFGEPLCLAEGTLVRMGDFSVKKIEDIQIGDYVLGYDYDNLTRPTKVLNVFNNGVQDCIETRFKKSKGSVDVFHSIISTPNHRLLMAFGARKKTTEVHSIGGDFPSYVQRLKLAGQFDDMGLETNNFDLLAGLLLGGGSYAGGSTQGVFLSCCDKSLIEDTDVYFRSLGIHAVPQHTDGKYRISSINSRVQINLPNGGYVTNPAKEFLKNSGMWGKLATEKEIPSCMYKWSNRSIARVISGLIASDGWISVPRGRNNILIGFSSTSRRLVHQFKELLELRFGVYGSEITERNKPRGDGTFYNTQYTFNVCNGEDIRKLASVLDIPGVKGRKLRSAIEKIKPKVNRESGRVTFNQYSYGPVQTYDIEVDNKTHLYVLANQVVTHNSQSLLKSKHTAGVSNAAGVTGFKAINAMFQVPGVYPNKATLATVDGLVEKIEELPQGGSNVYINGVAHYVSPFRKITAKQGETLEAGDSISEGAINPSEITSLKGIGQGRLNFIKDLKDIFKQNGVSINRRNAEVVAKASIDHVQINDIDETSSYLPDDIVRYGSFVRSYQPREDSKMISPSQAIGYYLEKPALHYSIGTKITNSVAKNLEKFGDKEVLAHPTPPAFTPKMVRLMDAPSYNEDWMAQLGTSYVQKNLTKNVVEGTSFSDIHGKHPLPALAYGKEFGKPPVGTVGY